MCNFENNSNIIIFKEMDINLNSSLQLLKFSHNVSPPRKTCTYRTSRDLSIYFVISVICFNVLISLGNLRNILTSLKTSYTGNWMVNAGIFVKLNSCKELCLLLLLSFKTIQHFIIKDVNFIITGNTSMGLENSLICQQVCL